jgi:hypothetical protein
MHSFLAYFLYFEKIKVGLWDHLALCVPIYTATTVFVCIRCCRKAFTEPFPSNSRLLFYYSNLRHHVSLHSKVVGCGVFCVVRVLSIFNMHWKESRWLFLPRTSCILLKYRLKSSNLKIWRNLRTPGKKLWEIGTDFKPTLINRSNVFMHCMCALYVGAGGVAATTFLNKKRLSAYVGIHYCQP